MVSIDDMPELFVSFDSKYILLPTFSLFMFMFMFFFQLFPNLGIMFSDRKIIYIL